MIDEFLDDRGRYRTQSLFIEFKTDKFPAPFTLKREDTEDAVSMYRLYMEIADPTEYAFAMKVLGSWNHWDRFVRSEPAWFMPYINSWREELSIKLKAEHRIRMEEVSVHGKTATERMTATKWLAQNSGYSQPAKPIRGRPSKEEVSGALKRGLMEADLLKEDAERLGLGD